jgi:hypothetical protein
MIKVIWNNINGQSGQGRFDTNLEAQSWLDQHLANNTFGKPERWLPDFLEGVETREVLVQEATEAHEVEQPIYNESMEQIGTELVMIPSTPAQYNTEYLHPAEYTYEIVEESLAVLKARKKSELSAQSLSLNTELVKWNAYRSANALAGVYDETTLNNYKASYKALSDSLRNEYYRLSALVDLCTTESEINNIQFSLE